MRRLIPVRFSFDRSLFLSLLCRAWQVVSGPITIAFIVSTLSPVEQGFYYAFTGIAGLQAFFELGLLNVLVSFAAFESGKRRGSDTLNANSFALANANSSNLPNARLTTLIEGSKRWFLAMSLLYFVFAVSFGTWTLSAEQGTADWFYPLLALIGLSAFSISFSPLLAILEGGGQREDIYRLRLFQIVNGSLVVWVSLFLGIGIWSLVAAAAVQCVWGFYIVKIRHARLLYQWGASHTPDSSSVSWTHEVLPAQWRMAAITISSHIATQLLVVWIFRFRSAEEAGRLGMTLTITSAITAIAHTWLQVNLPVLSSEFGAQRFGEAVYLWRRVTMVSTSVLVLGMFFFVLGLEVTAYVSPKLSTRFLTPFQTTILAAGYLASHLMTVQGMAVLAKFRRPLTRAPVAGFLLTGFLVFAGARLKGLDGVLYGFAIGLAIVALPLHTLAYYKQFRH